MDMQHTAQNNTCIYTKPMLIQADAIACGLGAALIQNERPIAFAPSLMFKQDMLI